MLSPSSRDPVTNAKPHTETSSSPSAAVLKASAIATLKRLLRPITRYRDVPEQLRYLGIPILDNESGNARIGAALRARKPAAIAKFGASELGGVVRFLARRGADDVCRSWGKHRQLLHVNAGVYPATPESLSAFSRTYLAAAAELDILGVWFRPGEAKIRARYAPRAELIAMSGISPFPFRAPWTAELAGRRVLVVTPFAQSVMRQAARLEDVWRKRPEMMPGCRVSTLRCPLSAGLVAPEYPTWHAALDAMKAAMSTSDAEVVLVGAGAWSLPLVAHAKTLGKIGIHTGGLTQLLFGIRGGRWDPDPFFTALATEAWVRPNETETPTGAHLIENACYW